jgi:hypothetical protein
MTFISLKGSRESLSGKSEDYKEKIKGYMKSRGYVLTHDSTVDGILPDLVFNRPYVDGKKETWIESKFTDLSLTDDSFLSELGRVFNGYMQRNDHQRFSYFIFGKKCLSVKKWKNIFDETKCYPDDVKGLMGSISDNLEGTDLEIFKSYTYDDFVYFINDITLVEGDYADLSRATESILKKDEFDVDQELLKDVSNVIQKKEFLTGNFVKITSLPEILWIAESKKKIDANFWKITRNAIAYPHANKIYSVNPFQKNSEIMEYVKTETIRKINVSEWKEDEKLKDNILKYLIKSYVIYKGRKIKLAYYHDLGCLFFHNPNPMKYNIFKHKNRVVSKYYAEADFVKHDAIRVDVKKIGNDFYIVFNMIIIFTKDGYEIITGESASSLHKKFTRKYTYNDKEKNKLLDWTKFFGFNIGSIFDLEKEHFTLTPCVDTECPISYDGGEDFDVTLLDFLNGEEQVDKEEEKKCTSAPTI